MTNRCTRCGRRLTRPTSTGLGPVCERSVFGSRRKREKKQEPVRDGKTRDLFEEGAA